ncbi:DUF4924 family protein [Anditalea andensis]|uniref:DUF4924 domain-containing protein n=1 Tax=Anditalea andensis TaxID=1048983 RepID=A0A074L3R0_9BACT|nr:DUF4924 family protein [Anditalea andensis]KEO74488.1 hypothetical protein EL17_07045 [Anditalea andensis]
MKDLAEKKKKTNIGEYIIYMYQMEDLLRSYKFESNDIKQYVVSHYPVSEEEKTVIAKWFDELAHKMKVQGIEEKGHLNEVKSVVDELAHIHWDLLKKDKDYFKIYGYAKPHVIDFIASAEGQDLGHEIQICLNGVYGLLLCRLTGRTVTEKLEEAVTSFGQVLGYLNAVYMDNKKTKLTHG